MNLYFKLSVFLLNIIEIADQSIIDEILKYLLNKQVHLFACDMENKQSSTYNTEVKYSYIFQWQAFSPLNEEW